jgi:pyruvate kinase
LSGGISNHKGVNLPRTILDLSPLTTKDRGDLEFGLHLGVEWVALASICAETSGPDRGTGSDRRTRGLVAKIEKPAALERIDDIIQMPDAIMIARGWEVPGRRKELVRACRLAVKPAIVVTQTTRVEASDVATAIYDGADAVMLSVGSATGEYPCKAVEMMDRIVCSTEQHRMYRPIVAGIPLARAETTNYLRAVSVPWRHRSPWSG